MKRWSLAAACLVLGGLLGSYFVAPALHGQQKDPPPAIPKELTSYRDIVKRVLPAVVSLDIKMKAGPVPEPGKDQRVTFGSGVIVDTRGVVLTSYHVVAAAESVEVTLADGRKLTSRDIRGDKKTDVAIVILDAKTGPYPHLALANSDEVEIGDRVLAVGAPFGLAGSVTHGIISGKGRSGLNLNTYEDFLQTDAAINPGNSGGPLVSLDGKVVGICAAIKSKNGGFQGVGLAIASNICKTVVTGLVNEGVVKRGYLGVHIRELTPALAAELKQQGVVIGEVYDSTPASKAGLKVGDVITSFGGKPATDTKALQAIVLSLPLNKAAPMNIIRNGKAMTVQVTIEEHPGEYGKEPVPEARNMEQQHNAVPAILAAGLANSPTLTQARSP